MVNSLWASFFNRWLARSELKNHQNLQTLTNKSNCWSLPIF
jgi:hypothetical protein